MSRWVLVLTASLVAASLGRSGSGVIAGTVRDAVTGTALTDVVVTLSGRGLAPTRVLVDDRGRFAFPVAGAGTFSIGAARPGYLLFAPGSPLPTPARTFDLAPGERAVDLDLRLAKLSAVDGVITGQFGLPLAGVEVRAIRRTPGGPASAPTPGAPQQPLGGPVTETDERGRYRLTGLPPGDYLVAARPPRDPETPLLLGLLAANPAVASDVMAGLAANLQTRRAAPVLDATLPFYPLTLHPNATTMAGGKVISIEAGRDRSDVNFLLKPARGVQIEGTLIGPDDVVSGMPVRLLLADDSNDASPLIVAASVAEADGRFQFTGVTPGAYRIRADRAPIVAAGPPPPGRAAGPPPPGPGANATPSIDPSWTGGAPITSGVRDISGLSLTLTRAVGSDRGQTGVRPRPTTPASSAVRATTAARSPVAMVSGIVSDHRTRQPLAGALVMIAGTNVGGIDVTRTDVRGRFTFPALRPGQYILGAQHPGYLIGSHAAFGPSRPGRLVGVRASEQRTNVDVSLVKAATITGRVTSASGQPIPDARVRVQPRRDVGGEIAAAADAGDPINAVTDDRGMYRVFNLPPGEYVVAVQPRRGGGGPTRVLTAADVDAVIRGEAIALPSPNEGVAIGYESRYFGGLTQLTRAATVILQAGEVREGVDVQTTLVPHVRVEGMIADGAGPGGRGVQITLRPRDRDVTGALLTNFAATVGPQGMFTFNGVPPGEYTIVARALPAPTNVDAPPMGEPPGAPTRAAAAGVRWATHDVTVAGQHVSGLRLTMQPALSVSGRVVLEGAASLPPDLPVIRVGLRPTQASQPVPPVDPVAIDSSGRFTIAGLLPGRYRVFVQIPGNVVTQVPEWFAKSAVAGGGDAFDVPIDLGPTGNVTDVVVTLTENSQEIDGVVQNGSGTPVRDCAVLVFPVDKRLRFPQSRRVAARATGADGTFVFGLAAALPPGEYYIVAIPGDRPNEQFDPGYLDALVASAVRVSLGFNETRTVTLRVPIAR